MAKKGGKFWANEKKQTMPLPECKSNGNYQGMPSKMEMEHKEARNIGSPTSHTEEHDAENITYSVMDSIK